MACKGCEGRDVDETRENGARGVTERTEPAVSRRDHRRQRREIEEEYKRKARAPRDVKRRRVML